MDFYKFFSKQVDELADDAARLSLAYHYEILVEESERSKKKNIMCFSSDWKEDRKLIKKHLKAFKLVMKYYMLPEEYDKIMEEVHKCHE